MSQRIAIIGGGKIGEALLAGLIQSGKQTKDLVVAEKSGPGPPRWLTSTACW